MTKIEKMAECWWYANKNSGDDQVFGEIEAYIAGFKAAREMIVAAIKREIGPAGLPTVGVNPNMGDEEVKL